jgi:hypothetical protein
LGDKNTATIVMEALWEQALSWALLLQDEKPESAASWKLLQPLLLDRFDKVVNETQKFKLIAALQQRQNKRLFGSLQDGLVRVAQKTEDQVQGAD